MNARTLHIIALLLAWLPWASAAGQPPAAGGPPAPPPARKIPGITVEDAFPQGCVSCHVQLPDRDVRLSTLMTQWTQAVDKKLLAKAQRFAPQGVTLVGKHPIVADALNDIPAACFECHAESSHEAPPFARMMHGLHLADDSQSHFMTLFQGECTHCHKFNAHTGEWSLPSASEP